MAQMKALELEEEEEIPTFDGCCTSVDQAIKQENKYSLQQIGNAGSVDVTFDIPGMLLVTESGEEMVPVFSADGEKECMQVMLCITADGQKLPPYIVVKRKVLPETELFPTGVYVSANEDGLMNDDYVLDWVQKVWLQRPDDVLQQPAVLVLSTSNRHINDNVKHMLRVYRTDVIIVNSAVASQVLPLNVSVTKIFKEATQKLYTEWLLAISPTGVLDRASLSQMCDWILQAWNEVPTEVVIQSFEKGGISRAFERSEDNMTLERNADSNNSGYDLDNDTLADGEIRKEPVQLNEFSVAKMEAVEEDELLQQDRICCDAIVPETGMHSTDEMISKAAGGKRKLAESIIDPGASKLTLLEMRKNHEDEMHALRMHREQEKHDVVMGILALQKKFLERKLQA